MERSGRERSYSAKPEGARKLVIGLTVASLYRVYPRSNHRPESSGAGRTSLRDAPHRPAEDTAGVDRVPHLVPSSCAGTVAHVTEFSIVITRKVLHCSQNEAGTEVAGMFKSVLETVQKKGLDLVQSVRKSCAPA